MSGRHDEHKAGASVSASLTRERSVTAALTAPGGPCSEAGGLHGCPGPRSAANLGRWLNEPVIMNPVIAFLKSAEYPVLMREVADGCAIPSSSANRVLLRLHSAGRVSRYRLPMQRPGYCHRRKASTPGTATRNLFVYSWVRRKPG
jgi:hypothetical protein